MKKTFGILMLLGTFFCYGQDIKSIIGVSGGYSTDGFGGLIEYNHYITENSRLDLGLFFSAAESKNQQNFDVPYNNASLNVGYSYVIIQDRFRRFLTSIGGGGIVGYEFINGGDSDLDNGALINGDNKFIYGGYLGLNINFLITDSLALSGVINEYYHQNSDLGNFSFYGGLGIKYYIF